MKKSARIGLVLFLFGSVSLAAQDVDVPLRNWTVPPYTLQSTGGGLSTMTDVAGPRAFIPITPCRIADTRGNGFTGQAGPPALTTAPRSFQIDGTVPGIPSQCGIPDDTSAVSFQFTVVTPNSAGNLVAWPSGPAPSISVLNWSAGETALGNGTIVPLSFGGSVSVQVNAAAPGATAHLVIDVNGYFSHSHESAISFLVVSHGPAAIRGENDSTSVGTVAVQGVITSPTPGAAAIGVQGVILSSSPPTGTVGVRGVNNGTGADGFGVWGSHAGGGAGVLGETVSGMGVFGKATASSGLARGVFGHTSSNSIDTSGVYGQAGAGLTIGFALDVAGVRGQTGDPFGLGVLGVSRRAGVSGVLVDATGGGLVDGYLATNFGVDPGGGGPNWAVFGSGDIGASGSKFFVDPHPTDSSKVIGYIALEGPEAGTYFRGRARFQRGLAVIPVPEDFRLVTDPAGLTVQITPMGGMATFGVLKADLDEVVVQASRDLEFSYLVQGVRATSPRRPPIFEDGMFRPTRADARMPEWLTEGQKQRLVQNGTYKADGTVNMETARRNGWDRMWEAREGPAPAPRPE
jgi:hypothetical protein